MILALLQARVSSVRLPGKVLKPILGRPMLARMIERVRRAKSLDKIVVATSSDPEDRSVVEMCSTEGVDCFRGSLEDVLDRFYQAAKSAEPAHVVRLCGDCPLIDPEVVDRTIALHLEGGYDLTSNTFEPTFPDGLDVEIIRFTSLERAWREARLPSEREHVTSFFGQHPGEFRLGSLKSDVALSHLRWCVDDETDFKLVSAVYEALYPANPDFTTQDILSWLDAHPEYKTLNAGTVRNEGYLKSLKEDDSFLKSRGGSGHGE